MEAKAGKAPGPARESWKLGCAEENSGQGFPQTANCSAAPTEYPRTSAVWWETQLCSKHQAASPKVCGHNLSEACPLHHQELLQSNHCPGPHRMAWCRGLQGGWNLCREPLTTWMQYEAPAPPYRVKGHSSCALAPASRRQLLLLSGTGSP